MENKNNIFVEVYDKVKLFYQENKRSLFRQLRTVAVLSFIVTLWFEQQLENLSGNTTVVLSRLFKMYLNGWLLLHIVIFVLVNTLLIYFRRLTKKDYHYDKDRNLQISDRADKGSNRLLQSKEEVETVYAVEEIENTDAPILGGLGGKYDGNSTIALKPCTDLVFQRIKHPDENLNMITIGRAGSSKTRSEVNPRIYQCVRRGESFICTDTKGNAVKEHYYLCVDHGYTVKIVNFKDDELIYSDGVDIFSCIGDYEKIKEITDPFEREQAINVAMINCDLVAKVVHDNLSEKVPNREADFWEKEGLNFIKFWVAYVFFNEAIDKKSFGYIYEQLTRLKVKPTSPASQKQEDSYIEDMIEEIKGSEILEKTCLEPFNTFCAGQEVIRASVHAGLAITLQVFKNDLITRITSEDEVDLSLPAKQKCAYFFVMSDVSQTNRFLIATIFTLMYQRLISYCDSKQNQMADIPVTVFFDEFTNVGVIPMMSIYLSTLRSRCIRHELYVQTMALFKKTYSEEDIEAIMSNCAYHVILATEEPEVTKRYSERSGYMTIRQVSERHTLSKLMLFQLHPEVVATEDVQQREVLLASEIATLKDYELLVVKSGNEIAKIHTWDYSNHPFYKKYKDKPYHTTYHVPLWKMREIQRMQKEQEREKKAYG